MECIYCGFKLPNNAKFCPKCLHQVICINCGEVLFKDSSICISCGNSLKNNSHSNNSAVNNIEFTENESGKTFKASFTDTVAGNVVETFAQLLPINSYPSQKRLQSSNGINENIEYLGAVEVLDSIQDSTNNSTYPSSNTSNDLIELEKIFKNKNGAISIYDPRIKAKSKSDFIGRITLLFIYYKELLGDNEVKRTELNDLLEKVNLKDAIIRTYLSHNQNLINSEQNSLELRPEGKELAQKILSEFCDSSIPNNWDLKSNGSNGKKSSPAKEESKDITNGSEKSKAPKKLLSYQILSSLNLRPAGKKSLVDFCSDFNAKNNFEYNLLFIYYLERILQEENISINHLYTCYKELKLKVPNIYQSIADTKSRKGWIDNSDINAMKIPIAGENYLEHTMKK